MQRCAELGKMEKEVSLLLHSLQTAVAAPFTVLLSSRGGAGLERSTWAAVEAVGCSPAESKSASM